MALTRKFLTALGIEAEKIDEIIAAHTEVTEALKRERDEAREKAAKLPEVQAELDTLKAAPDDGYKDKYTTLKAEYDKFRADTEAEKALAAKRAAYEEVCKDAGLNDKGVAKAIKYADWNAVELDDAGKVKDAKDHIKALKEEWAEHVVTTTTAGAKTPNPPANNGGALLTRDEIYKTDENGRFLMDAGQRQEALAKIIAAQQKG